MTFGGRGEIRTHERLATLPVFKTGALNRSATLPSKVSQALRLDADKNKLRIGPNSQFGMLTYDCQRLEPRWCRISVAARRSCARGSGIVAGRLTKNSAKRVAPRIGPLDGAISYP